MNSWTRSRWRLMDEAAHLGLFVGRITDNERGGLLGEELDEP